MICYVVIRPEDIVEVAIMRNKNDDTYSFVNLTKNHICACRFQTVGAAEADMDRLKSVGKILEYFRVDQICSPAESQAIALPVVHGFWKEICGNDMFCVHSYHCSECHELALRDELGVQVLSNICPNCGAIMDK